MENSYNNHNNLPLNECHVHKQWAYLNRTYILLHILVLSTIFYYRASFLFTKHDLKDHKIPLFPWLSIFIAELILSLFWILKQPFYWRPVTRTAFPERLPSGEEMPELDVFICTADPEREPTWDVMNTVISAMALDYPVEKLSVYLSDDGGAFVTLKGMKYTWGFATWWLPFCRKYNVKTLSPRAYWESVVHKENQSMEFIDDVKIIKEKYEVFKMKLQGKLERNGVGMDHFNTGSRDHLARIEEIYANSIKNDVEVESNPDHYEDMPRLVYVAREKRPSHPHNFKAGALNVLLRASSMLSNSPYILVLDCNMYCNDSI